MSSAVRDRRRGGANVRAWDVRAWDIRAGAAAVGILAILIRIPGAIRDAFWQDEIASAHVIIRSTPWGMVRQVARTEATPPLWYAGGWLLHELGLSVHGYRAISVLAGGVLAAVTVLVARRALPAWGALAAGVLVASGWQFVMHGRELRAYETFAAVSVVFVELLLRAVDREPPSRAGRWALPAATLAGALTNYFFLLDAAFVLLWLWRSRDPLVADRAPVLRGRVLIGLAPLLLWSPILVHQFFGQRFSWIGPFAATALIDTYWNVFAEHLPGFGGVLMPLLVLAAVCAGAWTLARASAAGALIGLLATGPVLVTACAWLLGAHVYDPRNLISAGPFAAIALLALLVALRARALRAGAPAWASAVGPLIAAGLGALVFAGAVVAEATPPAPYDAVAHALVAQGWQRPDPIMLFSDFDSWFAYRGPVEWYLPGDPYLTLGEPARGSVACRAVFVVAPGADAAAVRRTGLLASAQLHSGILVGRLRVPRVPIGPLWAGSHILVGTAQPACVRVIPETRIIATLRG